MAPLYGDDHNHIYRVALGNVHEIRKLASKTKFSSLRVSEDGHSKYIELPLSVGVELISTLDVFYDKPIDNNGNDMVEFIPSFPSIIQIQFKWEV